MDPEVSKAHTLQEASAFANTDFSMLLWLIMSKCFSGSSPWLASMSWPDFFFSSFFKNLFLSTEMGIHPSTADLAGAVGLAALTSLGNSPSERVTEQQGGHKAWWACWLHTDGD